MKKDVLTALLIGLVIGSGFALLAVKLPDILEKSPSVQTASQKNEPTPSVISADKSSLVINSPKDNSIFNENKINISGIAQPAVRLVIEAPSSSGVIESDKDGAFTAEVMLSEGGNPVYITSVDQSGNQESKVITLFYTTEKI